MDYIPLFGIEVDIPEPARLHRRSLPYLLSEIAMTTRMIINAFAAQFFEGAPLPPSR